MGGALSGVGRRLRGLAGPVPHGRARRAAPSALVVAFPTLEGALGGLRRRLDPSARAGMPAHVTVLYPFASAASRDPAIVGRLEARLGSTTAFPVVFDRIGWFDARVLYLVPAPSDRFAELTRAVVEEFPAFPPYRGSFATVVPHLTVGEDAPLRRLRGAARAVEPLLPLEAVATSVWLMEADGSAGWRHAHTIELRSS